MKKCHNAELPTRQYVDTDFADWYDQGLPPGLKQAYPHGLELPETLSGFEGQEIDNFETVLGNALTKAHQPLNEYHGLMHFQRTVENGHDGYEALQALLKVEIPEGFSQAVLLGKALHDYGHPGATFFADADPDRIPVGANVSMAVEWYSAWRASEYVADNGGTPAQQAVAAYIPAASAYGAQEIHGERLRLSRVAPQGISGLMMRAVDVIPAGGDFAASIVEDTAVLYGEKLPKGKQPPRTLEDYCRNREEFLTGYVLPTFDALDNAVGAELTDVVGWRERVHERLADNDEIRRTGSSVIRAMLRAQLQARYDVVLR